MKMEVEMEMEMEMDEDGGVDDCGDVERDMNES